MLTYMENLSKKNFKDFSRITSHFTYGVCESVEDTNCDDYVPEKFPLQGYTYFDHGHDYYLLCKFYFDLSSNQTVEFFLTYKYLKINAQQNIASIVIVNALILSISAELESLISLKPTSKDPK